IRLARSRASSVIGPLLWPIIFVARLECADLSFRLAAVDAVNLLDRAQQRGSPTSDRSQVRLIELQPTRLHRALEMRPVILRQGPIHIVIAGRQRRHAAYYCSQQVARSQLGVAGGLTLSLSPCLYLP